MGHRVGNSDAHVQNKPLSYEMASESFETKLRERIVLILTRVNMQATAAGGAGRITVIAFPAAHSQPPDFTKMAIPALSRSLSSYKLGF